MENRSNLSVAVIGAGVAGIVSAYLLRRKHAVTLYEKNDYLGGHTHTVEIPDGPDRGMPVDTGFIVFNDRTYPHFIRFLDELGVPRDKSVMSFSYYDRHSRFVYSSTHPFADRWNMVKPAFWLFLREIARFNRETKRRLDAGTLRDISLSEYLAERRFRRDFIERFIIPMGAAIWSTPDRLMLEFPAETFARFFDNHGLLTVSRHPQWYYVSGGSRSYVRAFEKIFTGEVFLDAPVREVRRDEQGVRLRRDDGTEATYDAVIIAAHGDEALSLLADPSPDEEALLGPWRYSDNRVILHRDTSLLPPNTRARASWNYLREAKPTEISPLSMTYDMNSLQQLPSETPYLVTLNPARPVDPDAVIAEFLYTHPIYSKAALEAQPLFATVNGERNTYFCGSYYRYGFHEDAVVSAVSVGERFGIAL